MFEHGCHPRFRGKGGSTAVFVPGAPANDLELEITKPIVLEMIGCAAVAIVFGVDHEGRTLDFIRGWLSDVAAGANPVSGVADWSIQKDAQDLAAGGKHVIEMILAKTF